MAEAFASVRPRISVQGQTRDDLGLALRALTLSRPAHGMAHGEIQAVCWGAGDQDPEPDYRFTDIALGDTLEVGFEREGREYSVFSGEITALEERYGEGAPHLVILVQDRLHRLARARRSRSFEDASPDDLVSRIAADAGLNGDARVSTVTATWHQLNESDLAFLFRVLGPFGAGLRLDGGGRLRARPEEPDPEPIALDIADNALRVRLIADLAQQPAETEVSGFDAAADTEVSGRVEAGSDPAMGTGNGSRARDHLTRLGWPGTERVPRPFPWTQGLADAFAQGHFDRRDRAFLTGEVRCIGDPRLAGGREIALTGTSPRTAGRYRVLECVHRFDSADGYRTHLRVARPDWGAGG